MEKVRPIPDEIEVAPSDTVEPQKPPQWWDMDEKMFDAESDNREVRREAWQVYQRMKWVVGIGQDRKHELGPKLIEGVFNSMKSGEELTLDDVSWVAQRELANGFREEERNDRVRDYRVVTATRRLLNEALAPAEEHTLFPPQEQPHESNGAHVAPDYQSIGDK